MTNYLKPGRYKHVEGHDLKVIADAREHGYTGLKPIIVVTKDGEYIGLWPLSEIQNPEAGPLPERPTVYIVTHGPNGDRFNAPVIASKRATANIYRRDGYTVHERPWPEEWADLLEGE